MTDVTSSSFRFPAVQRKKVTAAFDGGRITSDGGVLLLAQAEREMDICRQLATCIADRRDPSRVVHKLDDILRARVLAIACGYEDADDLDALLADLLDAVGPDHPLTRHAQGERARWST